MRVKRSQASTGSSGRAHKARAAAGCGTADTTADAIPVHAQPSTKQRKGHNWHKNSLARAAQRRTASKPKPQKYMQVQDPSVLRSGGLPACAAAASRTELEGVPAAEAAAAATAQDRPGSLRQRGSQKQGTTALPSCAMSATQQQQQQQQQQKRLPCAHTSAAQQQMLVLAKASSQWTAAPPFGLFRAPCVCPASTTAGTVACSQQQQQQQQQLALTSVIAVSTASNGAAQAAARATWTAQQQALLTLTPAAAASQQQQAAMVPQAAYMALLQQLQQQQQPQHQHQVLLLQALTKSVLCCVAVTPSLDSNTAATSGISTELPPAAAVLQGAAVESTVTGEHASSWRGMQTAEGADADVELLPRAAEPPPSGAAAPCAQAPALDGAVVVEVAAAGVLKGELVALLTSFEDVASGANVVRQGSARCNNLDTSTTLVVAPGPPGMHGSTEEAQQGAATEGAAAQGSCKPSHGALLQLAGPPAPGDNNAAGGASHAPATDRVALPCMPRGLDEPCKPRDFHKLCSGSHVTGSAGLGLVVQAEWGGLKVGCGRGTNAQDTWSCTYGFAECGGVARGGDECKCAVKCHDKFETDVYRSEWDVAIGNVGELLEWSHAVSSSSCAAAMPAVAAVMSKDDNRPPDVLDGGSVVCLNHQGAAGGKQQLQQHQQQQYQEQAEEDLDGSENNNMDVDDAASSEADMNIIDSDDDVSGGAGVDMNGGAAVAAAAASASAAGAVSAGTSAAWAAQLASVAM